MGAFRVLTHFDLNALVDQFARDIKVRPEGVDLLTPEYVVIQTPGMKKWLALECARRNSIFTQASVLMPKQFIMKLGFWLMGIQEKRSMFERDVLPWTLYRLITSGLQEGAGDLEELRKYAGEEDREIRLFSLAQKAADILDQYMLYRPDWIDKLESGRRVFPDLEAEVWQKYLWAHLMSESKADGVLSPSEYLRQLSHRLEHGTDDDKLRLPRRISLFGMSILPPQYLNILTKLGGLIDVTAYLQVPSMHYYGDFRSDRQIQWEKRLRKNLPDEYWRGASAGNRLLRNLGRMGQEFMELLLDLGPEPNELFNIEDEENRRDGTPTLLKSVQRDVLMCRDSANEPVVCEEKEWSIRLASCHGPLREVEVLHDLLLDCFANDATLAPSDILVVTPDIARYGPLVEMVFGDAQQRCGVSIPYSIADQSALSEDAIARFARDILTAVTGRFEASAVLPLFAGAAELSGEPISMDDAERLKRWCRNSGIRWGYDGPFWKDLKLPETEECTWRYGIDRILAGYAMDDEEKLADGFYPAVEVEGAGAELLGRLADFVDSLADLVRLSKESHAIDEWNGAFAPLIRRLLAAEGQPEDDDSEAASAFTGALSRLRERSEISGTGSQKFPFTIFMKSIVDELSESSGGKGFLQGAVTVAGMLPMRSIPFRVVALLGMNRGVFPRHTLRPLFDLMSQSPGRTGDRDSLKSDRYVFLETVLSAQDRLVITWSGFDSGDGSVLPPSVLVDEFRAHLNREYLLAAPAGKHGPAGDIVQVGYPLHPFSSRYRSAEKKDLPLQTWNQGWFKPMGAQEPGKPMFEWQVTEVPDEDPGVIDGNAIIKALSDPMRTFLEEGCRIKVPAREEQIADDELFALNNLEEWGLRDAILREELGIESDAVGRLIAQGSVPPGTPGLAAVEEERKVVNGQFADVLPAKCRQKFGDLLITREIERSRYRVSINTISLEGRTAFIVDAGEANAKRRLKLWIYHLFLNIEATVDTTFKTVDGTIRLPSVGREEALQHIKTLNDLASTCRRRLLPLILDVSLTYLDEGGSKEEAWKKLAEIIIPGGFRNWLFSRQWADAFGEVQNWDEAMSKLPGQEGSFAEVAESVFQPLLDCLEGGR